MLKKETVILSSIAEFDEAFVPDCYKGKQLPEDVSRGARKHGAKAAKRGISSEYVAICTGIQRDGKAVAETVNRAKPSGKELCGIFGTHIAEDTLILTDGLRSYKSLEAATGCTVVNVNTEKGKKVFNLNVVNSLHSYIKEMYGHYRGVAKNTLTATTHCSQLHSSVQTVWQNHCSIRCATLETAAIGIVCTISATTT